MQIDARIEAPSNRVEALATYYIEQMRHLQPCGPYFLTGFSFGGLVAFEMAQQLAARGEEVGMLALLDTYGPNAVKRLLPTAQTLFFNGNVFGKYNVALVRKSLQSRIKKLLIFPLVKSCKLAICEVYSQTGRSLPDRLQNFLFREQNQQAKQKYTPKAYSGRVVLMRANKMLFDWHRPHSYQEPTLGWSLLVKGGLEIHDVPGDHLSMLQEPNISVLAERLKACIQQSAAKTITSDIKSGF